jgi:hypothetical protein
MTTTHRPDHPTAAVRPADRAAADAAIEAGRHHETAGRLRDAVDEYTRAQRLAPDPALAHRIVRLRHDAVATLAGGPGAPEWPRRLADPFPGAVGPPEITPDRLDAATLGGAILHHGCLIVRGFQDEQRAVALREMVVRSLEARDRCVAGEPAPGDDEWYRPFEPRPDATVIERRWVQEVGGMLMADSPTVMCELLDVFAGSGATAAITEYLGEPPALSFNKCVLRKLRESAPTWHQDGKFMGTQLRTVDVWLSLSDCGEGATAPGLDIVPKRFEEILETETHGATFPNSIGQGLVDIVAADQPWMTPRFAPGDAILFDDRFVHRSGVGEGYTTERYAIESWFFAASRFPDSYVPILA